MAGSPDHTRGAAMFAIYMRVSTDQQDYRRQIHVVQDRCRAEGFDPAQLVEYLDDGYSGTNMIRPAIEKLKADIQAGKVQGLVVCDLSRVARNQIDCLTFLGFLRDHGVKVFDRRGEIKLESSMDVFMRVAESLADAMLSEKRSQDTKDGIKKAKLNGSYKGGAPAGSRNRAGKVKAISEYMDQNKRKIDPKKVLELYNRGLSIPDIAVAVDTYPNKVNRMLMRMVD